MSKRDSIYQQINSDGEWAWPADEAARKNFAQRLYGATLMQCLDITIRFADSLVNGVSRNPAEDPEGVIGMEVKLYRDGLSRLTEEEKVTVKQLIRRVTSQLIHSICTRQDQFPMADVEINLVNQSSGERMAVASPAEDEQRIRFLQWVEEFSDEL